MSMVSGFRRFRGVKGFMASYVLWCQWFHSFIGFLVSMVSWFHRFSNCKALATSAEKP